MQNITALVVALNVLWSPRRDKRRWCARSSRHSAALERWFIMKRSIFVTIAALALLVPTTAGAQGVKTVYRPEVHGTMVVVPDAAAQPAVKAVTLTPVEIISRHEAMLVGRRAGANARGGAAGFAAADHCERLITEAKKALRKEF
jgi:hypothetical protein